VSFLSRLNRFAAATFANLRLTSALLWPRPFPRDKIDASPAQVFASFLIVHAAIIAFFAWIAWPVGEIDPYGVQGILASTTVGLASVTFGALLTRSGDRIAAALILTNLVSIPILALAVAIYGLASVGIGPFFGAFLGVALMALGLYTLAALRVFARPGRAGRLAGLPAALLLIAASAAWEIYVPQSDLFYSAALEDEAADDIPEIVTEDLYYAQPTLMQAALDGLAPGTPREPELFALLGAGYAYQDVFMSEVDRTATLLAARHGTGRTVKLANSEKEPTRLPMLNHHNLSDGLQALAGRMGPEDTALLFFTSHGSEDRLSLSFYEARLEGLTPHDLATKLDAAGLTNVVIVISACHSGSFIDELAAPDRLIITASAADRTSFGCADGRDWTDFGRAFFDIALRETPDFRAAFTRATRLIEGWEAEQGRPASHPQIAEGAEIGPVLDALFAIEISQDG